MANGTNPGQFASILGGSGSALIQAMQKRGIDPSSIPALNQVSASAPTAENAPPAPIPQENPQVGSIQQTAGQAVGELKSQFRSAEMETALKALAGVAKTEADIAKNVLGLRQERIV